MTKSWRSLRPKLGTSHHPKETGHKMSPEEAKNISDIGTFVRPYGFLKILLCALLPMYVPTYLLKLEGIALTYYFHYPTKGNLVLKWF